MKDCKDCRHYRRYWLFATCAAPRARGSDWCECAIHRLFASCAETDCGAEGRFFEPIPLGKSHGIDWDRAAKAATTIAEMREFCAKNQNAVIHFDDKMTPYLMTTIKLTWKIIPRRCFTIAEYLAALTTDYCAG